MPGPAPPSSYPAMRQKHCVWSFSTYVWCVCVLLLVLAAAAHDEALCGPTLSVHDTLCARKTNENARPGVLWGSCVGFCVRLLAHQQPCTSHL